MISFLPVLSSGSHNNPRDGACVMEYVSLLAGEPWSDAPICTHPALARMAQVVNDNLSDAERPALVPLIGRLFGTAEAGTQLERHVLSTRLAVWCAQQVLPFVPSDVTPTCVQAIEAAQAWADQPTPAHASAASYAATAAAFAAAKAAYAASAATGTDAATAAAYAAGTAATYAAATYAAADAAAGTSATYAATAGTAATYAATAAAYAAGTADATGTAAASAAAKAAYAASAATGTSATFAAAATAGTSAAGVGLLSEFIDEYDRLTGRTSVDSTAPALEAQALYTGLCGVKA